MIIPVIILKFTISTYKYLLLIVLKNIYWEDRIVFLEWENTHMHQISSDNHTKQYGSKENPLMLQYNLDGKVQKQYQYMCQDGANTLFWYLPTEYKDDLDSPDSGGVNQIKLWFEVYLYEWFWDSIKLQLWQLGRFPASHKQILITHLLTKAWIQVWSHPECLDRYFTKVGYYVSTTGKDNHFNFPHNFSSGDILVCDTGDNSFVSLIQINPDSVDTSEAYMLDQGVVDTMVDDMLEAM